MNTFGEGSLRAATLLELYSRLVLSPQAVLVVDSLSRRFRGAGATSADLAAYLGVPAANIAAALDEIPQAICYASQGSNFDESMAENDVAGSENPNADMSRPVVRHYINYRSALPWVVAHSRRILLQLCRIERPVVVPSATNTAASPAAPAAATNRAATKHRANDGKGYYCAGCTGWFEIDSDLRTPAGNCAVCNNDLVQSTLEAAQSAWDACYDSKAMPEFCGKQSPDGHPVPQLLRMDRCVLQQALVLRYLCSKPFCFVDAHHAVVDPDAVMTLDEFNDRAKHRSSLALQFRAKHRNGKHLRLRLDVSLAEKEKRAVAANEVRLVKRRALPPWLQSGSSSTSDGVTAPAKRQRDETIRSRLPWESVAAHATAVVARAEMESFDDMVVLFERRRSKD
jgi:hypothetical protein